MKRLMAILLSLMLLAGCKAAPDAAQVGEALCKLYVHGDSTVSSVLSKWDTASIAESIKGDLLEQFAANVEEVTGQPLDEELAKKVTDAVMEARSRIPVSVEIIESDKESAVVEVSIGCLDISAIDTAAAEAALAAVKEQAEDSDAYRQAFVEAYAEALTEGLAAADATAEQSSFQVTFRKNSGLWLPEDLNGFVEELAKHIRR